MKFTAKRFIGAGVIGIAAIVAPISLTAGLPLLTSSQGAIASAAGASCTPTNAAYDTICFVQAINGVPDTYQYLPAGSNNATVQSATISGSCATVSGASAYLNMCGVVYPSADYSGTSKAAVLGTNGTATGVGAVSPAWTIDNKTSGNKSQAEAIDFSTGPGVTGSPPFNDAQIQIQRKDTGVAQNPALVVQLVESDGQGNIVGAQNCTISGNTGTQITADTNGPGSGTPPAGSNTVCVQTPAGSPAPAVFKTVEVRDLTNSTSISVVNTSTFTLQKQICGSQQVQTSNGAISATLVDKATSGTVCKSYTSFTSSTDANGQNQNVSFGGGSGNLPLTITINWAPQTPACQPDDTGPMPQCPATTVSFDGQAFSDQTYCAPADPNTLPAGTLCTTNKTYNYVTVNGVTETQITELWQGNVDCCYWR